MSIKGEVYRMTIASEEILGALEAFSCLSLAQMPTGARSLLKKFQVQATKIQVGVATPAYINTGANTNRIKSISVQDLGVNEDDFSQGTNAGIVTPDMLSCGGNNSIIPAKPNADLDDVSLAQLEALEKAMLAEIASNGAGSENVIPERRKVPRILEPVITTDDL